MISQVVLSLVLPVPMLALVGLTRDRRVMGDFRSSRGVTALAMLAAGFVLVLNAVLLLQTVGVHVPGLPPA